MYSWWRARGLVTGPLNGLKILNRAEIFGQFSFILGRTDSGRNPDRYTSGRGASVVLQLMSPFAYPYGGHRYVQLQTCAWSMVNSSDQLSEQFGLQQQQQTHAALVFGCQVSPAWRHLRLSSFSGPSGEESIIYCSIVALPVA